MTDHFADFKTLFGTSPTNLGFAANRPRLHSHELLQLGDDLESDGRLISASVAGDIKDLGNSPAPAMHSARQLGTKGLIAAGCLDKFAAAAGAFDTKVETLNFEWSQIHMKEVCLAPDAPTEAVLEHRYSKARRRLKSEAEESARMLRHPHDLDNVRLLFDQGFIPLAALKDWPGLKKLIIREVNSGKILDPKLALALPSTAFSKDGQKALAAWIQQHTATLASYLRDGETINLPPMPDGYELDLTLVDSPTLKLSYLLSISPDTGVTSLTFTGGDQPDLSGSLSDGTNSVSLGQDGWSVSSAIASAGDSHAGIDWDKDGPWLTASHDSTMPNGNDMEIDLKVRPPAPDPGSGDPEPEPHHSPVGRFLHGVEEAGESAFNHAKDGITSVPGHIKDGAVGGAKWFGDQWEGVGDDPALVRNFEYAGLAGLAIVGVGVVAVG